MAKIGRAKNRPSQNSPRKPLVWLYGEVKTPPFTTAGRKEAGMLLRLLQEGERLGMPQAEPLPIVGPQCGALRIRDAGHNWRIMYRIDADAVVVLEVYAKKTRKVPNGCNRTSASCFLGKFANLALHIAHVWPHQW